MLLLLWYRDGDDSMAVEVKVNLEMLDNVWRTYEKEITDLKGIIDRIDKTIEALRASAWKTNGADEFFKTYDTTWRQYFDEHISYLEHLRDCLAKAKGEFGEAYKRNKSLY